MPNKGFTRRPSTEAPSLDRAISAKMATMEVSSALPELAFLQRQRLTSGDETYAKKFNDKFLSISRQLSEIGLDLEAEGLFDSPEGDGYLQRFQLDPQRRKMMEIFNRYGKLIETEMRELNPDRVVALSGARMLFVAFNDGGAVLHDQSVVPIGKNSDLLGQYRYVPPEITLGLIEDVKDARLQAARKELKSARMLEDLAADIRDHHK